MEYREILINEIAEVAILYNELAYFIQNETEDAYWDFEILSEDIVRESLSTFIGNPEHKIFIARDEKKIVGFVAGEIISCHLPISSIKKVGYITGAFVLPEHRGKGVVKSLEILIIDFFKQCGLQYVELSFISKNTIAKKSWESMGYQTFREQARKEI